MIKKAYVPSSPSAGLGMTGTGPGGGSGDGIGFGTVGGFGHGSSGDGHVLGAISDAPIALADPLAHAICAVIPKVRACYVLAVGAGASITGDLVAEVTIDESHATSAKRLRGSVTDATLTTCALAALTGLALPSDVPSSTATYTLQFTPATVSTPVREASTTVVGALPPEVVRRIIRANFGRFRFCYDQGLKKQPTLAGTVSTHVILDDTGAVESAKSTGGTLSDPSVAECIRGIFITLSFPEPTSGKVTVDSTISFATE